MFLYAVYLKERNPTGINDVRCCFRGDNDQDALVRIKDHPEYGDMWKEWGFELHNLSTETIVMKFIGVPNPGKKDECVV